ncbi:unnamed protein product, partial [Ranitomeya imitator]
QVSSYISRPSQTNGFLQTFGKAPTRDPAPRTLRNSFSGHDPQHHTIDSLEQGIASLMDRLHAIENQRRQDRK